MKFQKICSAVVLAACTIASSPMPSSATFHAGDPDCTIAVGEIKCLTQGQTECIVRVNVCNQGDTYNAISCTDGTGQPSPCGTHSNCVPANNATWDSNCNDVPVPGGGMGG